MYQTIDLFAYGFVRNTSIPVQILPSYCRNGSPDNPACGAVALQNIALAKKSGLISQRGLGYAELSCGRLVLGGVSTFSRTTQVVSLRALPQKRQGTVKFCITDLPDTENLRISAHPTSGVLEPGDEVEVMLVLDTGALPAAFLEDIAFRIEFVAREPAQTNVFTSQRLSNQPQTY